ncbi:uncharacterized protein LOC143709682 [Siphateles boraxobius]|uniref:uncharacterized protein LOC143709682 n=1 Tax=Siphateles boraxobius TaxID=180520 RepID=UPI004064087B
MNAVKAVQLFILVWTFTAVCQADGDISVSCADVTGTVRKEVTFTCSVSLKKSKHCITLYKFLYPEKYSDSEICREDFPQDCEKRNNFTYRFSSTAVMTGQFRFFIQTNRGLKLTAFTVNITGDISVSCADVTGTVSEEITFTCSISLKKSEHCIQSYKFLYPEKYGSTICRADFPLNPCEQGNSFTCRFSSTTVMTEQFRFFVQVNGGQKQTAFTVNITESSKPETVTEAPDPNAAMAVVGSVTTKSPETDNGFRSRNTVIAAVTGCFIIIIIITIIYKKKPNYSKAEFQRRISRCVNPALNSP